MNLQLPWGDNDLLDIKLPKDWVISKEFYPGDIRPPGDLIDMLKLSLLNPIEHMPLSKLSLCDKKVTIIVDDTSRPTPVKLIFPIVLEELKNAGVRNDNIAIVIALGTHSPLDKSEISNRLGIEELGEYKIINHNCYDNTTLKRLGKTISGTEVFINKEVCDADLIIPIGTIEPHLIAGFGGGLKNIIPGCAGIITISATHLKVHARERFMAVGNMGEECPTRLLIEEGASMLLGDIFLVNTVLSRKGETIGVFCGDPIKAHREGCKLSEKICRANIEEKADVVITGSHPMDIDLRQGSKCLANVSGALKEDGLLIACMRCYNGVGDMAVPDYFLPFDLMRILAKECGAENLTKIREKYLHSMDMDDKYMTQYFNEICRKHHVLVYAPSLPLDTGYKIGTFELFPNKENLFKRATNLIAKPNVIYSFPYGGASYGF